VPKVRVCFTKMVLFLAVISQTGVPNVTIARKRRIERRRRKPGVAANNERLKYTSKVDKPSVFLAKCKIRVAVCRCHGAEV